MSILIKNFSMKDIIFIPFPQGFSDNETQMRVMMES